MKHSLILLLFQCAFLNVYAQSWLDHVQMDKLKPSLDSFQMIKDGKVVGQMIFRKWQKGDVWIMQDTSELFGVVKETLEMKMFPEGPRMKDASMHMASANQELSMQLTWSENRISGNYSLNAQGNTRNIPIDTTFDQPVLGRGALFGLVQTLPMEMLQTYDCPVWAFSSAELWPMKLKVESQETIEIEGKDLAVFRLSLTGGKVDNFLFITTGDNPQLVRVDVPAMELIIQKHKI